MRGRLGFYCRYTARWCFVIFSIAICALYFTCLFKDTDGKKYLYLPYMKKLEVNTSQADKIIELQKTIMQLQTDLKYSKKLLNKTEQKLIDYSQYKEDSSEYHHLTKFFIQKIKESEISKGRVLHNEYEIIPFDRFTVNRLYLVNPGMGKRVVEKPIGLKKSELTESILFGAKVLNEKFKSRTFTIDDFYEGIYRTEPGIGTHYDLYFKTIKNSINSDFEKVTLTRSFAPLKLIHNENISSKKELINIIIPLKNRLKTFQSFMNRFVKVCVMHDRNVFLTVVYFGSDGMKEVQSYMTNISSLYEFKNMKLVMLNTTFSRGLGLQAGVDSWKYGDVLMFFCDVDIVFTSEFLQRCRMNTIKNKKVYYPMVFSLYNPNVVYNLHKLPIPDKDDQMLVSKDTGFWRDFGFGMTCQYMSDFKNVGGISEHLSGWGMEDVLLYRKYVKSNLLIIRTPDHGIFHYWHEKYCEANTNWDQYGGCIRSKALNEASHSQLGMLAFKEEIKEYERLFIKNQSSL